MFNPYERVPVRWTSVRRTRDPRYAAARSKSVFFRLLIRTDHQQESRSSFASPSPKIEKQTDSVRLSLLSPFIAEYDHVLSSPCPLPNPSVLSRSGKVSLYRDGSRSLNSMCKSPNNAFDRYGSRTSRYQSANLLSERNRLREVGASKQRGRQRARERGRRFERL